MEESADLLIIGAGAAGLATAIFAAEACAGSRRRIVVLEGARKPGAKILVSGGGRCNVTHDRVTADDYFGGPSTIVRNILKAFPEKRTRTWFESMGVELKLEPTGKWFPVSDKARTILDALLQRCAELGVDLVTGTRVEALEKASTPAGGFVARTPTVSWRARRVVIATGGMALPKSGSDGWGFHVLRHWGHTIVHPVPALAPVTLGDSADVDLRALSGIAHDLRLTATHTDGWPIWSFTGSTLLTHFGLSGPAPMNISRHLARARADHQPAQLILSHPMFASTAEADRWLLAETARSGHRRVASALGGLYPERLAEAIAGAQAGRLVDLRKEERSGLAGRLAGWRLPVSGDRGFAFAETTAGGVELREVDPKTMQSRIVPNLYIVGEILDVDGRIGGFNFQWAWATGYLAGRSTVA